MKKPQNQPKNKPKNQLNPKELEADIIKVMDFIDKIDSMDPETFNVEQLEKDTILLKEAIEGKYNNILKKHNIDLDTTE